MRYFLNVYRIGFVYIGLRFYTAWAESRHSKCSVNGGIVSKSSGLVD